MEPDLLCCFDYSILTLETQQNFHFVALEKFRVLGVTPPFQYSGNYPFFPGALPCFCGVRYFGGINMSIMRKIRLIGACFRLAGGFGLIAGVKYALGFLTLDETAPESFNCGGVSLE